MSRARILLGVVLLCGAALRLHGLDWGLPWALHIDERLFVVENARQLDESLGDGLPDPGITSYGILPLWLVVAARRLFLGLVTTAGPPTWGSELAGTVLLARWLSALWGIAAIALVWAWARRWGETTGVATAALVAGMPSLVQAAHFGTVEMTLVALLVAGLLAAERLAEKPSAGRAAAGGVMLGLALSVKAPGALLGLPLLHAAWDGNRRDFLARAGILVGVAIVIVLALNPGLVAGPLGGEGGGGGGVEAGGADGAVAALEERAGEHTTLLGNLRRAYSADFHDWTLPYAHDVPVWTELTRLLPHGMGILPELAALLGLAVVLARAVSRRRGAAAPVGRARELRLLLFLVPLLLVVLPARVKTIRFLLPALPVLALLAAEGLRVVARAGRVRVAALTLLSVLTLLHGAAFTAIYRETDARVAAREWLTANAGPLENVVIEDPPGYGPPLRSPSAAVGEPLRRCRVLWQGFYAVHEKLDEAGRAAHLEEVLARADWLALSEGHREEFVRAGDLRPVERRFYADLDAGRLPFVRVATFKSYPRLGPLALRDDGAEVLMRVFDHPRIDIWRRVPDEPASDEPVPDEPAPHEETEP